VYAPILVFTGACEGVSEGLWLVALLSLVDDKGASACAHASRDTAY